MSEKEFNEDEEVEKIFNQSSAKLNNYKGSGVREIIRAIATTTAGAGVGVASGIAAVTVAATLEVVLPVTLCLSTLGITCGAVGLLLGIGKKK